jgi:hypothetical protein
MRLSTLLPLAIASVAQAAVSWQATPFNPSSFPLAVRTPYLSAWLPQGAGAALNDIWPQFWTGSFLGWAGFVKVDGTAYSFLGNTIINGVSFNKAVQKSSTFTATQSVFVLTAGPVDITVTFLSPVEPKDLLKQSLPFSYMTVTAVSNNGGSHNVQVYSDISAEWVSGNNDLTVNWNTTTTNNIITHQTQLTSPSLYSEANDHTQYGSAFYSIENLSGTTYQTGQDTVVRANFIKSGNLPNTKDSNFRAISNNWPVFGFARNLGTVGTSQSSPVVFTVGHVRDPSIQYILKGGALQDRHPYHITKYSSATQIIAAFLPDYSNALTRAKAFDAQVHSDASKISSDYASIVDLSIRQVLAATELTVSKDGSGNANATDVLLFMKEISSDGNMNTVDVIFPSWPALLYLNPTMGRYLLDVLFRYQASGLYPNKWSVHDVGGSYPKALGHNDGGDEAMPVEESGNMLIMTLSYTQKTGDKYLISTYTKLLDQWTQFLITDSLIPGNQLSTDDFAGRLENQTNLAIKGIVGIRAMGEIYRLLGDNTKADNYTSIAASYVTKWQTLAASKTGAHMTLNYNNDASWGLTYNLFGDKLLKLNLFPKSVYDSQTAWYKTVAKPYGVPLDTRHTYTKSDWEIWTAAISSTTEVRDLFISSVKKYAAAGISSQPLGDWYETTNANPQGFRNRPVVGGHLALLDL